MALWRNGLSRSAVNRKVGGSNPPRGVYIFEFSINVIVKQEKYGTLHEFACHPCAGAMLIFSVSFQF